ncbi:hypothetical protein HDU91_007226 [Kappamyces sp. JEL0680]|nr:hypothetical protein HDU91_007226 [Kappamyces sp. JEL0680]
MTNPVDFPTALLSTYSGSGLVWSQVVGTATETNPGCVLIAYSYCLQPQFLRSRPLWKVLLTHAITGFLGSFCENIFLAKQISDPNENWAVLLGLNELNWIIFESSTVAYSILKLDIIILDPRHVLWLHRVMFVLFLGFAAFRIDIGVLRYRFNTTMNEDIAQAHAHAFVWWGVADLIVLVLLMHYTLDYVKMAILIVIVGQLTASSQAVTNLNTWVWTVKGVYPIVLLFDMQTTKTVLASNDRSKEHQLSYISRALPSDLADSPAGALSRPAEAATHLVSFDAIQD